MMPHRLSFLRWANTDRDGVISMTHLARLIWQDWISQTLQDGPWTSCSFPQILVSITHLSFFQPSCAHNLKNNKSYNTFDHTTSLSFTKTNPFDPLRLCTAWTFTGFPHMTEPYAREANFLRRIMRTKWKAKENKETTRNAMTWSAHNVVEPSTGGRQH